MKTKLIIASAILFVASATSAFATPWIGSAVNVNGTWYSTKTLGWNPEPSLFNNQNLGAISALNLGGLSLVFPETNMQEETMTMGYKIDGVQQTDITLEFIGNEGSNRKYQSGGNNFTGISVDISTLSYEGTHTIEVWFVVRTKYENNDNDYLWDSNGGNNFKASFTRKAPTSIAKSSDITVNQTTPVDVQINGLTLYKDGYWNTLCLPFNLTRGDFEMTVLNVNNVEIRKLLDTSKLDGSTLTLNFSGALTPEHEYDILIEAGKPYIIKWDNVGGTISNPIFTNVKLTTNQAGSVSGTGVTFKGTFDQITYNSEPDNILFVGAGNVLNYPASGATINPFRAYFELGGGSKVKAVELNFGDDTNSIQTISNEASSNEDYYTIDGRLLNGKPSTSGLFIHNGRKIIIK